MRCPKCHYISFDSSDRCRNCGYEFALAVDVKGLDLPIQTGDEAIGPFSDFTLSDPDGPARDAAATGASAALPQQRPIPSAFDLPLFRDRNADVDAPLVPPAAVPRPPLAVRRSSPAAGRTAPRAPLEEPELDLGVPSPTDRTREGEPVAPTDGLTPAASAGSRIAAAFLDAVILGTITVVVVYLTLKVCGLGIASLGVIPLVPFASFLLLIAGGYFTLFVAANGQTIGKMAAGLKVVPADGETVRVPLGHAVVRAAAYLVSALPAGLGFVPALVSADRRAIHDRLAATRVVKA